MTRGSATPTPWLTANDKEKEEAIMAPPRKKLKKIRKTRYLKHSENGNICIWTPILEKREDMLPCDKDGKLLSRADSRYDISDLSIMDKITSCRRIADLIDLGARFDVGFEKDMKLKDMKLALIDELKEKGEIDDDDGEEDPDDGEGGEDGEE